MRLLFFLALASCVADSSVNGGPGEENGPCFQNMTCNAGLQCVSGTCKRLTADGGACVLGTSQIGNCTLGK